MTTTNPIADDVEREMSGIDPGLIESLAHEDRTSAWAKHSELPENTSNKRPASNEGFLSDLLDGQQQVIAAQHQFLHDSDLAKLAAAQRRFIFLQSSILDRLGVFG